MIYDMVSIDSAEVLKARFVGSVETPQLKIRQIPVCIGEDAEYVLQFGADDMFPYFLKVLDSDTDHQKNYQAFVDRIKILTDKELNTSLQCRFDEMMNVLSSTTSCVGCRRAVENSFNLVSTMDYHTLSPIKLLKCSEHETCCEFTLECEYLKSSKKLFMLLYICKFQMEAIINSIPKSRKNKRCYLHCLDSHKVKSISVWMDFWKSLNRDSRDEITTINIDAFVEALESYLQKHRFCQECKAKVERAYKLLLKDVKPDEGDQEYDELVFEGIKVCKADRHLHIDSDDDTIASLINRAEPELTNRRERHAKTMDVAQEEVLTCLGIVLHEKMHKLCQKVKAEEQTWMTLVNVCLECLKRRLELAVEKKRGYSELDLFLAEHEEETKKKELKKEIKREKKRKKKQARKVTSEATDSCDHSPSKDEFSYNEEEEEEYEEDEEDEYEEERERAPPKPPDGTAPEVEGHHPMELSTGEHLPREENHEADGATSEWQVVENSHCKQCSKRKMKPRGGDEGREHSRRSFQHASEESSQPRRGGTQNSNSGERQSTNDGQASESGSSVNSRRKPKLGSDVTTSASASASCCGGATARLPSKTEKNDQSALTARQNHSNVHSKSRVPVASNTNANSRRSQCSRTAASSAPQKPSSSSLPSAATAGVTSADRSSCRGQTSSSGEPAFARNHSCNDRTVRRGASCYHHDCRDNQAREPSQQVTLDANLSSREVQTAQSAQTVHWDREAHPLQNIDHAFNYDTLSPTEDPENCEDFIPEHERLFFMDNWEEIIKDRDILRKQLRQRWSDKTKANG